MKERPFPLQLSRLAKATDADLSLASLGTKDGSHLFTRLTSKETEFSKRIEVLREHGLISPITIRNGTESTNHDYIVVGGRPVIHANIHGVTVPMYMTSGQAAKIDGQKLKLPGFLPFGGVLADGYFSKLHHDGPADESNGWGNRHIQRVMQVLNYNLFGGHIPPRRVYSRNDLPEALHLTEYTPEEKKVNGETQYENFAPVMIPITPEQEKKNRAIKKQIQSLATAQSAVLPATGHDPLQNTEDHRARGGEALPATIAAITSQIDANAGMETAPGSGVTHEKMLGAKIARVHKIAAVRNSMLQANGLANMTVPAATPVAKSRMTAPFPLQLSLLAKASSEPSGSQPEQWIAPGGEQLRGEKARMFFLNHAYGNADYAARDHQRAIDEHNALYLADKQPRGRAGGFIVPKEKQDGLPPSMSWNPIDGETEDEPRESDPTFKVKKFNEKRRPATPRKGETQEQANERERDKLWQEVKDSLAAHTDPFTISADPNNPRQWKYHGLQNSFANHDAFNNIPLHELYNQLSKAYKTPAWQRAEGQNPEGGLNAKGRASAKAEGHNLKAPVKSGDNPRRASFLARMGNSPGPEYDEHGKPTRLLLSLQAWGASSKADARRKAKAISARLKARG